MIDSQGEGFHVPGEPGQKPVHEFGSLPVPESHQASPDAESFSAADQREQAEALRTLQEAMAAQQQSQEKEVHSSSHTLPSIKTSSGEQTPALQGIKDLFSRLTAPFRGIMNVVRSIGRWITK